MTAELDFDRHLRVLYHQAADASVVPGQVARVLMATEAVAQRPAWWARLHRTGAGTQTRSVVVSRRTTFAFAVALAMLAVVAVVLSRPRPPSGRGLLAFVQNGDLMLADSQGHDAVPVLRGRGLTITDPVWSPDGRRLVVGGLGDGLTVVDAVSLMTTRIPVTQVVAFAWSPDGTQIAVVQGPWQTGCWPPTGWLGGGCRNLDTATSLELVDVRTGETSVVAHPFPSGHLAWSPDGHWIAASVDGRLTLVDPTTHDQHIVLDGDEQHGTDWPSWSPDSQHLAFEHLDCTTGRPACSRAVAVVGLDGTPVGDLTGYSGWQPKPAWSPDGSWIAYEIDVKDLPVPAGQSGEALPGLALVRPDGTDQHVIESRPVATWSWDPDAAALSYTMPSQAGQVESRLVRYPLATGTTAEITAEAGTFAWQPTGRRARVPELPSPVPDPDAVIPLTEVVTPVGTPMAAPASGSLATLSECDLKVLDFVTDTTATTNISDCLALPQPPQLSPDGRSLLVVDKAHATLLRSTGRIDLGPIDPTASSFSWSPDGRWLVRTDCPPADQCRWWLLTAVGRPVRSFPTQLNWTEDGRRTWTWVEQQTTNDPSEGDLAVGDADGSNLLPIGRFPSPVWSSNGERFAFARDGDVWVSSPDGSDARRVTTFGDGSFDSLAWAPQGDRLVLTRGASVWIAAIDGTPARPLGLPRGQFHGTWSPDGRQLVVMGAAEGESFDGDLSRLYLVDVDRGTAALLRGAENPLWSPDGRSIAIQHVSSTSGEVSVDVVNADGSGRRLVTTVPSLSGLAWLR